MKYKVILHPQALQEAIQAAAYIQDQASLKVALRWHAGLQTVIDSLALMPLGSPLARENGALPGIELRQTVYKSHRLIFMITKREVHVLHIRHAARDKANIADLSDPIDEV